MVTVSSNGKIFLGTTCREKSSGLMLVNLMSGITSFSTSYMKDESSGFPFIFKHSPRPHE